MGNLKRWIVAASLFFVTTPLWAPMSSRLNIQETDGSPSVFPWQLKVSPGTLTDNGDGTATLATGSGGGGGGGSSTLAVTTGTASGFTSIASSPTAIVNFDNTYFSSSLKGGATNFVSWIGTTSNITEGSNLYYTDARARLSLSATQPILYNNSTGVFSATLISATTGITGVIPISNGGTNTSSTLTGLVRGGASYTASELSGDATTSGSNSLTLSASQTHITSIAPSGTLTLGSAGNSVAISSNTVLPGTTFYANAPAVLGSAPILSALSASSLVKTDANKGLASAAASDVVAAFTGCSGTQYLGADGSCHTDQTGSGGASTLAIATGTASGFGSPAGTVISSPTAVVNFDSTDFKGQLTSANTAFIQLNTVAITSYTVAGTNIYTLPSHCVSLEIWLCAAGGSGGGGNGQAAGSGRGGGTGGGGGSCVELSLQCNNLGSSVVFNTGVGAAGGGGGTNNNGSNGTAGLTSSIYTVGGSTYAFVYGGGFGFGNQNADAAGGGGGGWCGVGSNGAAAATAGGCPTTATNANGIGGGGGGSTTSAVGKPADFGGAGGGAGRATVAGAAGGVSERGAGGGGGAGGITAASPGTSGTSGAGGASGNMSSVSGGGGSAGNINGVNPGSTGTNGSFGYGGYGGGAGGANNAGTGGAGGDGGYCGGGGGGGGGGTATGGKGGKGGDGCAIIISHSM